ncbi:hypothetical protein LINPERHAP1_LOCUS23191 [Linum perenne]
MRAADEDKVLLTLNLLQGTAYHWWLTQPASQQDPPEITWEEFLRAFRERFLPPFYHEDKMQDFLTIKQEWGSEDRESVADYTARFEQLLPYGGLLYQVPVAQRDHYLNGLRPQLQVHVHQRLEGSLGSLPCGNELGKGRPSNSRKKVCEQGIGKEEGGWVT